MEYQKREHGGRVQSQQPTESEKTARCSSVEYSRSHIFLEQKC